MKVIKPLLALSVLAVAGAAHAATVGTYNVAVSGNTFDWSGAVEPGTVIGGNTGTGTATLDDSGVLTISSTFTFTAQVAEDFEVVSNLTATSIFQGTYSGGTFTVASGTERYDTCSGYCSAGLLGGPADGTVTRDYDLSFGETQGSVALLSGGTVVGDVSLAGGTYQTLRTFTLSPTAPAVPIPAAAWLFGSGLIGLAGSARRRRAANQSAN